MKFRKLIISGIAAFTAISISAANAGAVSADSIAVRIEASSSGVNVETRTQSEIKNYIKAHPFSTTAAPTYTVQPDLTSPYTDSGALSGDALTNGLNALNAMRYIAGIDAVTISSEYNKLCQDAAYIGALNNSISHAPSQPSGMSNSVFQSGATGCGSSNLALGYTNIAASVLGYLNDSSARNIDKLGHRRWCLNPSMKQTGFGQVKNSEAMYSFDNSFGATSYDGVVWPAQNMPLDYFDNTQAWSYTLGKAISNPANVKVTLKRAADGRTWTFSAASANGYFNIENSNYGKPGCVIFRPDNIVYAAGDTFTVTITGLDRTVNYTVNFFSLSEPTTVKPATVSGVKTSAATSSSVTLGWNKVSGADSYQVDIYKDGKWVKAAKVSGTSCTITGLEPSTSYSIRVFAFNGSIYSNPVTFSVSTAAAKPLTVTNLKSTAATANSITLSWTKTNTADSYQVDVYKDGKWTRVTKTTNSTCTVTGLSASTSYKFRVFSFKGSEYSPSASITVSTSAAVSSKPLTVTNLKSTAATADSITLSWTKTNTADSYQVDVYKGGKWTKVAKVTGNTCTVTGLSPLTSYKFRVFSFKGSLYSPSASITVSTVSAKPATVTNLRSTAVTSNSITLTWTKTNTADSYQVDIYLNGKWVKAGKLTGNTCTVSGLSSASAYKFRVFSFKGSDYSSPATITVTTG